MFHYLVTKTFYNISFFCLSITWCIYKWQQQNQFLTNISLDLTKKLLRILFIDAIPKVELKFNTPFPPANKTTVASGFSGFSKRIFCSTEVLVSKVIKSSALNKDETKK